jgi:hypothetical protein
VVSETVTVALPLPSRALSVTVSVNGAPALELPLPGETGKDVELLLNVKLVGAIAAFCSSALPVLPPPVMVMALVDHVGKAPMGVSETGIVNVSALPPVSTTTVSVADTPD